MPSTRDLNTLLAFINGSKPMVKLSDAQATPEGVLEVAHDVINLCALHGHILNSPTSRSITNGGNKAIMYCACNPHPQQCTFRVYVENDDGIQLSMHKSTGSKMHTHAPLNTDRLVRFWARRNTGDIATRVQGLGAKIYFSPKDVPKTTTIDEKEEEDDDDEPFLRHEMQRFMQECQAAIAAMPANKANAKRCYDFNQTLEKIKKPKV